MCLVTFWTENWTFYTIKNIVLGKSQKLHFSTGVSPCFQWEFFHPSFLGKKRHSTLHRKLALLHHKNSNLRKSQNLHFFKGASPCFQSKTETFYILSFQAKKKAKKCLEMFCTEKQRCQSIKTPKVLVHAFSGKFEIFTILLRRENVFRGVLVEKLTFLRYKNVMLGKWQNLHLSMVLVEHLKFLCFLCRQNRSCKSVEYSFQGEKQLFFKSKHKKFQDLFFCQQ